jgi:hypothetical protein
VYPAVSLLPIAAFSNARIPRLSSLQIFRRAQEMVMLCCYPPLLQLTAAMRRSSRVCTAARFPTKAAVKIDELHVTALMNAGSEECLTL